jgi:hypothetical protein
MRPGLKRILWFWYVVSRCPRILSSKECILIIQNPPCKESTFADIDFFAFRERVCRSIIVVNNGFCTDCGCKAEKCEPRHDFSHITSKVYLFSLCYRVGLSSSSSSTPCSIRYVTVASIPVRRPR